MNSGYYSINLGKLRICYTTKALGSFTFARARREDVLANYCRLEEKAGIALNKIARAHLDNGLKVVRVTEEHAGRGVLYEPGPLMKVDALYTNVPNLYIGMCTADCFALTLHDRVQRVVGMAHCGWR